MWAWVTSIWTRFWTWLRTGGAFAVIGKVFFVVVVILFVPRMISAVLGGAVSGWQYGWGGAQPAVQRPATQSAAPSVQPTPAVTQKPRRVMRPGKGEWFNLDPNKDSIEIELPPRWGYFLQPPDGGWVAIYVNGQLKDKLTYDEFEKGKQLSNKSWVFTLRGSAGGRAYLQLADR